MKCVITYIVTNMSSYIKRIRKDIEPAKLKLTLSFFLVLPQQRESGIKKEHAYTREGSQFKWEGQKQPTKAKRSDV